MAKVVKGKVRRVAKRKRPELFTKEELIEYIENSNGLELPFLEELWERCVIQAEKDKQNGRKTVEVITTNADGTTTKKGKQSGFWSDNPVAWYYKQCALPQWRKKSADLAEEREQLAENKQKIMSSAFSDSADETYADEVVNWINMFIPEEKNYLKQRYAHYYDTYEINEGADKLTLKGLLSLEIACHRIDLKRALGQTINVKEEETIRKQVREALESLKWTKKQRNAREDMAQNKFTVWIQDVSKNESFEPKKRTYDKDEIDFLLDVYIESAREIMS